jgi:ubiquinol-cytochrome c reductase cytochrome b subunit
MLHEHGSNNPNGVTSNGDRFSMHPYFIFKDLVTILLFLLMLSIVVFYYPNVLGQMWPTIILNFINIIYVCAICWEDLIIYSFNNIIKIYNKTIFVSDLFIIKFIRKKIILKINPDIVRYYFKKYNQQITKIIIKIFTNLLDIFSEFYLLLVGISETIRTHKFNIINKIKFKSFFSKKNNTPDFKVIKDNHNNEISLKFKE